MPVIGRRCLAIDVVKGAAASQAAGQAELRPVAFEGDDVRRIGLDLDGVKASGRRRVDQAERPVQGAVVIT